MSYVVDKSPEKYGGRQEEYLNASKEIVKSTAELFKKAVSEKTDLTKLFHDVLQDLSDKRKGIALEHKTKNGERFGTRRDGINFEGPSCLTALHDPYQKYNDILLPLIQGHLKEMKHGLKAFDQKELKINFEPCQGIRSSMDLKINSVEQLDDWQFEFSEDNYLKICKICKLTPLKEVDFKSLVENLDVMMTLKTNAPELYGKLKLAIVIIHIRRTYPEWRKSDWVVITRRLEIDQKMYALSQYVTWFYRDLQTDPIENMTGKSRIVILHEDPFLIQPLLNDVANVFKKVIETDSKDRLAVKKLMAEFDYKLSHIMPFERGSAGILGWLRGAIGSFHNFSIAESKDTAVDMEALSSSFPDFMKNYESFVTLKETS